MSNDPKFFQALDLSTGGHSPLLIAHLLRVKEKPSQFGLIRDGARVLLCYALTRKEDEVSE